RYSQITSVGAQATAHRLGRIRKELDWNDAANEYVEVYNGGYYVSGTRIGLDVVTYDFRRGWSAEAIFEAYPSIGSLGRVYGAITFILEHPAEVEAYLKDQDRIFEQIKAQYPMAQEMIDRFERAKK